MTQALTDPWAQRLRALAPIAWAAVALIATYLWSRVVRERLGGRRVRATTCRAAADRGTDVPGGEDERSRKER